MMSIERHTTTSFKRRCTASQGFPRARLSGSPAWPSLTHLEDEPDDLLRFLSLLEELFFVFFFFLCLKYKHNVPFRTQSDRHLFNGCGMELQILPHSHQTPHSQRWESLQVCPRGCPAQQRP